jgi:integrase
MVSWREEAGRQYAGPFPSRDLAEKVRARVAYDRTLERAGLPPDAESIPAFAYHGDAWLERHKDIHRSHGDDVSRWKCHVRPWFGGKRPAEIDHAEIRRFVEAKKSDLDPATVGHCVKLLSRIFGDLVERPQETGVSVNPVRTLPKSTRRLCRPKHDPKTTPFLERLEEAEALAAKLEEPFSTMYAVGVYGMLRTGEVLGVFAEDVDLQARRILVRRQVQFGKLGPLKDDESRVVPIQGPLMPRLASRKLIAGPMGPLFPTTRKRGGGKRRSPSRFISIHTLHARFAEAAKAIERPDILEWDMPWYQATRHTGASHWVASGGNIATLAAIMGHSTTWVTERYAHLRPDLFAAEDYDRLAVGSRLAPEQPSARGRKQLIRKADR